MHPICVTCGTQFAIAVEQCAICEDERQYVGLDGQQWVSLGELRGGHANRFEQDEPGLISISTEPKFAIGQRAFVLQTQAGNILWDCISLLDQPTIAHIQSLGGLRAIAISHPHYYTTMVEWSRAFGDAPIYLHQGDREWVMRPDPAIRFWHGETHPLFGGLTLIRCGGHFEGGTVLHSPAGALLSGDIIQVAPDRRWVSFMYSYPNYIPLDPLSVKRIADAVQPFQFDRVYGAFPKMSISADGKGAISRSAERYIRAIQKGI
jgi:hypothetical protein